METAHSLIHNGFLKVHSTTVGGKTYEYTEVGPTVTTLLVEPQDNPLNDLLTIGIQYRVGASVGALKENAIYTLASGYVDNDETSTDAAHREAEEEFGAKGSVFKLGAAYNNPGSSTQITELFWMDVKEWSEPTDVSEGIKSVKLTLGQILHMIKSPYVVMSMPLSQAVLLYAAWKGV